MKIISWNVNGIRACEKKGFLKFLKKENPDFLCIQESKAHEDQLSTELLSPTWSKEILAKADYQSIWSSAERKGYSGVASYIRSDLACNVKTTFGIGIKKFDTEGRFIIHEYTKNNKKFLLYNVYFPNGAASEERHNFKQEFLKKFLKHLKKKMQENLQIIVVGDYNIAHKAIDIHDPVRLAETSGFLPEERQWFDTFLASGFVDSYRSIYPQKKDKYSWWSYRSLARQNNKGWRLDYICSTKKLASKIKKVDILNKQLGSDHCPVLCEWD
ncbi:MAG: exodeoxyribonuclease III [Bdellovibrionaceae bacterium]|nr:exodeoxyribonuclease III [Pseudobdellovibrionaceae bacterium]